MIQIYTINALMDLMTGQDQFMPVILMKQGT